MILGTVGTNEAPFDRLLAAIDRLSIEGELVVQHGPSAIRPAGARCVDYLDYDALTAEMRRARVVVTHAGVGSVMTSLENGRRPIVLPRLARFGEAVDDHQLEFGRRAASAGLVVLVEDADELAVAIATHASAPVAAPAADPALVEDLGGYIERAVKRRRARYSR